MVNQFRLFLSQAAYVLMLSLREAAEGTKLETASVTTLRERIIKTAAKVTVSVRRVLVELTAHCPFQEEMSLMAQRLTSKSQAIFS